MMNSRRICPADGSQYKQSAVGLVFMESAAGLAMETSKVKSGVRNQAEAKLNQLEHSKPAGKMKTQLQALKRTTAFCSCTKDAAGRLCVANQSQEPVARYQLEAYVLYQLDNQTQATAHPVESAKEKQLLL
ncbi:hypothetical protein F511_15870 [Dorcoceras hygrometricum]|uniref:Uncharacterized protein n=1 Tax=Dorcoceras hygrometricum TaxID=472368 RepID=A0A2Z7B9S8_9LAMI|nr:hypothetical protein F511_15870 [Dorcoceras hygrometricum]